jgi:hypothetical protein
MVFFGIPQLRVPQNIQFDGFSRARQRRKESFDIRRIHAGREVLLRPQHHRLELEEKRRRYKWDAAPFGDGK